MDYFFCISDSLNLLAIESGCSAESITPLLSERKKERELLNPENNFRPPSHKESFMFHLLIFERLMLSCSIYSFQF